MNGTEIATRVKRTFGDESGAQIQDADILRWINDAQREIAWNNDLLQIKATAAVVANQAGYSMPADILRLRSVKYQGVPLSGTSMQEADDLLSNYATPTQVPVGVPQTFWVYAQTITLYPTPSTAGATDLTLFYTRSPTELTALSQTPEIPTQYHNRIVEYCVAQAYELDDNLNASQAKLAQFKSGIESSRGDLDFVPQDVYPGITSLPSDYGDYGYC